MSETCTWFLEDSDDDHWVTECHNDFILLEGTPEDNGLKFCCYCGKQLKQEIGDNQND